VSDATGVVIAPDNLSSGIDAVRARDGGAVKIKPDESEVGVFRTAVVVGTRGPRIGCKQQGT
jgi:hypothetical protein